MKAENIKTFRKTQCKSKQDNRNKVNIMCTSLVATFIICWFPQHVWRLSRLRGIPISEDKVFTICICIYDCCTNKKVLFNIYFYLYYETRITLKIVKEETNT